MIALSCLNSVYITTITTTTTNQASKELILYLHEPVNGLALHAFVCDFTCMLHSDCKR